MSEAAVVADPAVARVALEANLERQGTVRLKVTGRCMEPCLCEGDVVELQRRTPRVGDVVLASLPQGLRLHRLLLKLPFAGGWRTKGDGSDPWDAAVSPADIVATVVRCERFGASPRSRLAALLSLGAALRWRLQVGPFA